MARAHVGYLGPPGLLSGPRAVAACPTLLAVSAWKRELQGPHVVHLFDAGSRAHLRTLGHMYGHGDGTLGCPNGLRLTAGGTRVVVADWHNDRLCCFSTGEEGAFVGSLACAGRPRDVEEVHGGFLVASDFKNVVECVWWGGGRGGRRCVVVVVCVIPFPYPLCSVCVWGGGARRPPRLRS